MNRKLVTLIAVVFATLFLSQQPPLESKAETTLGTYSDSTEAKANYLKAKINSFELIDSLKVYASKNDSVLTESKIKLSLLKKQQKQIQLIVKR